MSLQPKEFHEFSQGMSIIYGRKWLNQFEDQQGQPNEMAIKIWMVSLNKRGITKEDLWRCLDKTIDKHPKYAPRLPEVIEMCGLTEEDLGLPSFEQAFYEATIGRGRYTYRYWEWAQQTHLAVYHAVSYIKDKYNFDRAPEAQARKIFAEAWYYVVNQLKAGQKLAPVPKVIAHESHNFKEHKPCSPERAREWIEKCYAILKSSRPK